MKSHNPDNKILVGEDTTPNAYGKFGKRSGVGHVDDDGTETLQAWRCDESCPVYLLDIQSGERKSGGVTHQPKHGGYGFRPDRDQGTTVYREPDTGGASRFFPTFAWSESDFAALFYCPKASRRDRGDGNTHPTVKPQMLMRWLVKLVTPHGGTILDPFAGSGTTLLAAESLGFSSIGIEAEPDYCRIIERRYAAHKAAMPLLA